MILSELRIEWLQVAITSCAEHAVQCEMRGYRDVYRHECARLSGLTHALWLLTSYDLSDADALNVNEAIACAAWKLGAEGLPPIEVRTSEMAPEHLAEEPERIFEPQTPGVREVRRGSRKSDPMGGCRR